MTRTTLIPIRPNRLAAALWGAAVLVAILAASPRPARAAGVEIPPEARALIERHVDWLGGWHALDSLDDLTLSGRIQVSGLEGTVEVQSRRDYRQRTEYDLGVLRGTECLDGDAGWEENASGQIEDLGREKVRAARRSVGRSFGLHLLGEGGVASVDAADPTEKDGRTWSVVRFTYPDGDIHDLLLDPDSGASEWTRDVVDGREQWVRLSDFRMEGVLRVAGRQETFAQNPMENQAVTWERIVMNSGLREDLFARPGAGRQLARLPEGVTVTDWIPLDLFHDRYLFVPGSVNGVDTDIILDSGAGMTVLDAPTAEAAGLEATGSLPARGTGGTTEAGVVEGVTVGIGGVEVGPLAAAVLDLSDINRRLGRDLSVIFGKELFHALVVDIDYPGRRIRFLDPGTFRYDGPGHRLDVLPGDEGHKDVMMTVEGSEPAVFGLDTGQGGALTLFRTFAEKHGLLEGRRLSDRMGGGVGGETVSAVGTVASVTLAGYELHDVPVAFHQADVGGAFDTARQAGNLGAGILSRFRVIFDYPHGCLWLEPGPGLDEPFARNKTGLAFVPEDDGLTVHYVSPGSPAEKAGWKAGERVTALDGDPVTGDWWRTTTAWSEAPAGTTVRFTMADGSERTLVLAEYY